MELLESKGLLSKRAFACEGSRFQYIFKGGDGVSDGYVNKVLTPSLLPPLTRAGWRRGYL